LTKKVLGQCEGGYEQLNEVEDSFQSIFVGMCTLCGVCDSKVAFQR
jgi:hypothetical protein